MSTLQSLLADIPVPRMINAEQIFDPQSIKDIGVALKAEFKKPSITKRIRRDARIAVAVGSRGMAELPTLVRTTVEELKALGAVPFIVPSMGSHGGATPEGQAAILAHLGVTESTAGCPIISSMDTVEIGRLDNGLNVFLDKAAYEADGIVVINRVKPHNSFAGPNESGLVKMLSIGLGKQKGADACHAYGPEFMSSYITAMAKIKIETGKVLFGIGSVENAYDRIIHLEAAPAENLIEADQRMLILAKENMPRLMIDDIDVLIVDELGKEFSGGGMDGNITGRHPTPYRQGGAKISKLVVLDVSEKSKGNANGMGMADVMTRKLFNKIDFDALYTNTLTTTITTSSRIPMVMDSDLNAIRAAIKVCNAPDLRHARIVRACNLFCVNSHHRGTRSP